MLKIKHALRDILQSYLKKEIAMLYFPITYDKGKYEYAIIRNYDIFGYYKYPIGLYDEPIEKIELQWYEGKIRFLSLSENEFPHAKEFFEILKKNNISLAYSQNLGDIINEKWKDLYIDTLEQIEYKDSTFHLYKGWIYGKTSHQEYADIWENQYKYQQVINEGEMMFKFIYKDDIELAKEYVQKKFIPRIYCSEKLDFPNPKREKINQNGDILSPIIPISSRKRYFSEYPSNVFEKISKNKIHANPHAKIIRIVRILYESYGYTIFGIYKEVYNKDIKKWVLY
jgi:hypothetical protein